MVPVEDQDATLWQQEPIAEAQALLGNAVKQRQPGPFQIKAAIADCHMMRPQPDWRQMSLLYERLWGFEPTPVVALNWAVVVAQMGKLELALQKLNDLADTLKAFQPWHAARAHVLERLGRFDEARNAYKTAAANAPNLASKTMLMAKLAQLPGSIDLD